MLIAYPCYETIEEGASIWRARDLEEVVTDGAGDAFDTPLDGVRDAVEAALEARALQDRPLPKPSTPQDGDVLVPLDPIFAAKLARWFRDADLGLGV